MNRKFGVGSVQSRRSVHSVYEKKKIEMSNERLENVKKLVEEISNDLGQFLEKNKNFIENESGAFQQKFASLCYKLNIEPSLHVNQLTENRYKFLHNWQKLTMKLWKGRNIEQNDISYIVDLSVRIQEVLLVKSKKDTLTNINYISEVLKVPDKSIIKTAVDYMNGVFGKSIYTFEIKENEKMETFLCFTSLPFDFTSREIVRLVKTFTGVTFMEIKNMMKNTDGVEDAVHDLAHRGVLWEDVHGGQTYYYVM